MKYYSMLFWVGAVWLHLIVLYFIILYFVSTLVQNVGFKISGHKKCLKRFVGRKLRYFFHFFQPLGWFWLPPLIVCDKCNGKVNLTVSTVRNTGETGDINCLTIYNLLMIKAWLKWDYKQVTLVQLSSKLWYLERQKRNNF